MESLAFKERNGVMAQTIKAKVWVSRDAGSSSNYELWSRKPKLQPIGHYYQGSGGSGALGEFTPRAWAKFSTYRLRLGECKQVWCHLVVKPVPEPKAKKPKAKKKKAA